MTSHPSPPPLVPRPASSSRLFPADSIRGISPPSPSRRLPFPALLRRVPSSLPCKKKNGPRIPAKPAITYLKRKIIKCRHQLPSHAASTLTNHKPDEKNVSRLPFPALLRRVYSRSRRFSAGLISSSRPCPSLPLPQIATLPLVPISLPLEGYAPVCPLSQWPVPTVGPGAPAPVKAAPHQLPQEHHRIKHQEPHHSRFLLLLPVDSLMPHRRLAQCFPPCEYPWPDCQCHERAPRQKSIPYYLHSSFSRLPFPPFLRRAIPVPAVSPAGFVYRSRGFPAGLFV